MRQFSEEEEVMGVVSRGVLSKVSNDLSTACEIGVGS